MSRPQTPKLAVDGAIVEDGKIILIKRLNEPFKDMWALPGGFVDVGETVEDACIREVREETGLEVEVKKLLGVYSDPARDPRGHTVSVIFLCEKTGGELKAADDAKDAGYFSLNELPKLAFDHAKVLSDVFALL
ncbi:MAG TPA: NUDIX hydrolase [Candidatus Altiarchaeales archaeon]|nr:NUDIX hydrolase [Candidatus Altiarchaeales archaeon]